MKSRSNPESEFASVREPIIRQLWPLGLSANEIGLVLNRYYLTIQNDIKFMGGSNAVAPNRPTKKGGVYRACFQAWMDREQIGLAEMSVKAIEKRLGMPEIRVFAHGLASSMRALTTPICPKGFEPFAEILWGQKLPMDVSALGDELINQLIEAIGNNTREMPTSAQELRLALMELHMLDPERLEILTPFPEYMLEACQQALEELEREYSPREAYVLKRTAGIGCDKQGLSEIGREMELARERIRQIDLKARRHFVYQVRNILKGRSRYQESMAELIEDRDKLRERYEALSTTHKALEYQIREIAALVGSRDSGDLVEAVRRASGCVPSPHLFRHVDELELSVRAANCLQNAGVEYVWQILERTDTEWLKTKNFGRKSLKEIREILVELDPLFKLGMKFDPALRPTFPGLKFWQKGRYTE